MTEDTGYTANIIISGPAHLAKHFYIDFVGYHVIGIENKAETCVSTPNVQPRISYHSTFAETIVIERIPYFSDSERLAKHFYVSFVQYFMLGREYGTERGYRQQ